VNVALPDKAVAIAHVSQGAVAGETVESGFRFLGVPYAESPNSAGRFAAPRPAWAGVRPAKQYGATALQPDRGPTTIPEPIVPGANCLNLNVFTPTLEPARLPVLVWIHGGGFFAGCNASPWYVGSRFNRDGVVLVSINYRLGAEGFALLPDAPANPGVLDWIAALQWVQENVGAFGGDPGRVTIAGQSAGGAACATLLAVPQARRLFRAAICMSGSVGLERDRDDAEHVAASLAKLLGIALSRAAFEAVPAERLLAAQEQLFGRNGERTPTVEQLAEAMNGPSLPFAPVVDGTCCPSRSCRRLGRAHRATLQ
jgi:para-nitrobenzyl esterase